MTTHKKDHSGQWNKEKFPTCFKSFISKLVEAAVVVQMDKNVKMSGNAEILQSAYRCYHSTETALIKVREDILKSTGKGEITCLILLDLSAAFDTLAVKMVLTRFKYRFGFGGKVLRWLESYLTNRTQSVEIRGCSSQELDLKHGVPQGSLLGPKIFANFVAPIGDICRKHSVNFHGYADDTQNYSAFRVGVDGSQENCFTRLEKCVCEIADFMLVNKLKLNEDKTEFIMFGTRQQFKKLPVKLNIDICGEKIESVETVRNLGFWMDKHHTNRAHVNKLVSASYLTLRNIRSVKYKLDCETTKTLVQCLVLSRLDYCNSLLLGTSKCDLKKLQQIMHMGCRVIFGFRKFDHITPYLIELHWLKLEERIDYKLLTIIYKALSGDMPQYIQEMFTRPKRSHLRSGTGKLFQPRTTNSLQLNGSIKFAGVRLWNSLPADLHSCDTLETFKTKLKTFLFHKSYF